MQLLCLSLVVMRCQPLRRALYVGGICGISSN
ncbi:acetyltransferase [Vibrio cholerae]|nr:acetyltransferase [Vibrio cholerae]